MFSMNEWVLTGKVVSKTEKKNGYWVTVKGVAENPSLFSSDIYKIECWISKKVLGCKKIIKDIKVTGHFIFRKEDCHFVADKII